jgi:hypothetical protein
VSDVASAHCRHLENALIHRAGAVGELEEHITMVHNDRALLERLRAGALASAPRATWEQAGVDLVHAYRQALEGRSRVADSGRPLVGATTFGRAADGVADA